MTNTFHVSLRLLGAAILVWNAVLIPLALRAAAVEAATGRISLEGCKDCTSETYHVYECYHHNDELPNNPCYTDECIDNRFYYSKCEPDATDEVNNCEMEFDSEAPLVRQYFYLTEGSITCPDEEPGITEPIELPEDGPCQSPGFGSRTGKCFITEELCGSVLNPDRDPNPALRDDGRLVCAAP